jgi:hypothetical protein
LPAVIDTGTIFVITKSACGGAVSTTVVSAAVVAAVVVAVVAAVVSMAVVPNVSVVGVIPHWLQIAAVQKRIIVIRTEMIEYNLIFFILSSF